MSPVGKVSWVVVWLCTLPATSCIAGGNLYDTQAARYLRRRGFRQDLIDRLSERKPLTKTEVERLLRRDHVGVTAMLARNRWVETPVLLALYEKPGQHERILRGLAMNPRLPERVLLALHFEHGVPLRSFCFNPRCPPALVERIRGGDDELARQWLSQDLER